MNRNAHTAAMLGVVLSALLAAVLVGCGGESTPRIPAPPPFVPTSAVVQLGEQGGATTLISTQTGGWTHNGQPFASGDTVRGENAATYRLTLSGTSWSAAFVSPDPARVPLGTSGDEATLQQQEDGTYRLAGAAVQSGHVVDASNGNRYTLTLDASGSWSAEFLAPDPTRIVLGASGDSVYIEMREDRDYWLGGSPLTSGRVVEAASGSQYTLTFGADGMWTAVFVQPAPQRVALGASGRSVLVDRLENGTYQIEGGQLWAGEVREIGAAKYRFELGSDGRWIATYVAEPVTVLLGVYGGTISLVPQENGGWALGGEIIRTGRVVQGTNGHSYRLTLTDGAWQADPQPMAVPVALGRSGGSIVLARLEDGSYLHEGSPVQSGDVVDASNGNRYTLTLDTSGSWSAEFLAPDPTRIVLGASGDSVYVEMREDRSYWLDGSPLTSGRVVRAASGNRYTLTFGADGMWTAVFVQPDPERIALGTSGDSVHIEMREDRSYWLDGSPLTSGRVVRAASGSRYTLTFGADGMWTAVFVQPPPERIALGASGDSVYIEMREDRSYWLDGAPLTSGRVVQAASGSRYTLTFGADGMWTAAFVQPAPQRVALGSSGRSVLVDMLENGTYQIEGGQLWAGEIRQIGAAKYRFALGSDGRWTATYVAEPVTVLLGAHGGTISLVPQENGGWTLGGELIQTGRLVQGTNGHSYRLTLTDGTWRADPQPMSVQVPLRGTGGSIVLANVEDGSYLYEGTPVRSGDVISVGDTNYRLTQLADGSWRAALASAAPIPTPGEPLTSDSLATYVGVSPRVRLTDDEGTSTRVGSILVLDDLEYSVHALFTHGQHDREITFAEEARALITSELSDIEALISLADSARELDATIEQRWDRVTGHLDKLFPNEGSAILGSNAPKQRNGRIDYEEVAEDIQDVLAALESSTAFRSALERGGIFSASRRVDPDDSDDTFFAVRSVTRLGFGWTAATRYGAYSKLERSRISDTLDFASRTGGIGAFAYSPLQTTRTRELPSSGEAYYFGETVAASREYRQVIYTGDIELRVQFASRQVSALVTDLQDTGGSAWRHAQRDVDSIHLPVARLDSSLGSFEPVSSGTARVSFSPTFTRLESRTLAAEFEGRFLGRSEDAGDSAIGTWSLSSGGSVILAGGFGADLGSGPTRQPPVSRPPVDPSGDLGEEAATYVGAGPDQDGDIEIAALDAEGDRIEFAASELFVNRGTVVKGQRLFDRARADLDASLTLLDVYINLLGSQSLQERQEAWRSANETLRDNVFGRANVLGSTYPSTGRLSDRDEDAVELLQEAYAALAGPSSFRSAVLDGGVFENILSQSRLDNGDYDFDEISAALEYEVEAKYDHTNHTRFGVWAKQVRVNALAPPSLATSAERGDGFAYSPIGQTTYSSSDANFPRGFTSTYLGRTVAVDLGSDGPAFYDGDVQVSVSWRNGSPAGSSVTMVIDNLARTDTAEPLLDGQYEVSSLILGGASIQLDRNDRIGLGGTFSVRVRYVDPSRRERSSFTGSLEGKFVGYDPAGPRAVFGTWDWGNIEGAFGADLVP